MKRIPVQKKGFNKRALVAGPFWYIRKGMIGKGVLLLFICILSVGTGIIPVWIYCGVKGNRDFYRHLKKTNAYIRS